MNIRLALAKRLAPIRMVVRDEPVVLDPPAIEDEPVVLAPPVITELYHTTW